MVVGESGLARKEQLFLLQSVFQIRERPGFCSGQSWCHETGQRISVLYLLLLRVKVHCANSEK